VGGNYEALQFAFDAERAGALERSFETDGFIEKPGPFGDMSRLSLSKLPGQKSPQENYCADVIVSERGVRAQARGSITTSVVFTSG
jgi:hypothetical protein